MRDVGLEAGPHLLEGLVLVAEEGEGRLGAVFGGVGGMQQRIFIARPVEHDEVAAALGKREAAPAPMVQAAAKARRRSMEFMARNSPIAKTARRR